MVANNRAKILKQLATVAVFISAIITTIYTIDQRSFAVVFAYCIFGSAGLFIASLHGRKAVSLYLLGYGISCTISIILIYIYSARYGIPYFLGGSDDLSYEKDAFILLNHGLSYDRESFAYYIDQPYHNSVGYVYFISLLVRFGELFGGYHTLIPRLFNAMLFGLTAVIVARIAKKIDLNRTHSVIAGLWVILFPMMVYSSAHVFRDTITEIILMHGLYFSLCISFDKRNSFHIAWPLYTLPFLLLVPIMAQLRVLYVIPLLAMIISAWASKLIPINRFRSWHLIVALLSFFIIYSILASNELVYLAFRTMEVYNSAFEEGVQSASDGLSLVLFNLPQPLQTVGRIGYSIIAPLPIYYEIIEWNFLGLGSLIQILLFAYVALGLKGKANNPRYMPLLIGFIIIYFSYAMGTFTFRHITQWFPFAVLIGIVGYNDFVKYRKLIFNASVAAVMIFYLSYILMKIY